MNIPSKLALPFLRRDSFASPPPRTGIGEEWRLLLLFSLYRIALGGLFLLFYLTGFAPFVLGSSNGLLFTWTTAIYTLFAVLGGVTNLLRWPGFQTQVHIQVYIDLIALTLLMHASGGVTSGIGLLLVSAIAFGSLLMEGRTATLFAAMATVMILAQEIYAHIHALFDTTYYTHSGLLGASLFATAILAHRLAQRLRQTQQIAQRQQADLADMTALNRQIIGELQTGVVVLDAVHRVHFANSAAKELMGIEHLRPDTPLAQLSPALNSAFQRWRMERRDPQQDPDLPGDLPGRLRVRFRPLGRGVGMGTLLFLEDEEEVDRRVQQLKLASLGRLAGNMAHEIRNPIAAVSHAVQLLEESESYSEEERRLLGIVREQVRRVNQLVSDIQQLSGGGPPKRREIYLLPWLCQLVDDLRLSERLRPEQVLYRVEPKDTKVCLDPDHLRQIVLNLAINALRHGASEEGPLIELIGGATPISRRLHLDIRDRGPGVPEEARAKLFEPFFTTSANGTGLGLYIARQLAMLNEANLSYIPLEGRGSCFRITFEAWNR